MRDVPRSGRRSWTSAVHILPPDVTDRSDTLDAIAQDVRACARCTLHRGRKQPVPGEGTDLSGIFFIGEGPGFHENEQGRPFVGAAGQILTELLESIGLERRAVWITNVVRCRPPENRDPPVPVYGTKLTLGLLRTKLKEHKLHESTEFREIAVGTPFRIGRVEMEAYHVCHSIPDAVGFVARTVLGQIVHTGDWKFDRTPVDGHQTDFAHLARIAERGVHLLLSDSTRAEVPGYTRSEAYVGDLLESIFAQASGRIIITTFASNISRIKQIVDIEEGKLCIIPTGSQGEPTSALARMAVGDHKFVEVKPGDTVVLSATPIPGNEELVNRTIDNLYKLGAEVIYDAAVRPHVSGHASQEELKLMLNILRPEHFIPLHGEYRMLVRHARLAEDLGVPHENVHVLENGDVLELDEHGARLAGSVSAGYVYVDGVGVGDVTQVVVRDRWALASDGIFVVVVGVSHETGRLVSGPDIITKGFVPPEDEGEIVEASKRRILEAFDGAGPETRAELGVIKDRIHETVGPLLYERTRRRPMILPIVTEV